MSNPYNNFSESIKETCELTDFFLSKIDQSNIKHRLFEQIFYQFIIVRFVSILESYYEERIEVLLNSFHYFNRHFLNKEIKIGDLYESNPFFTNYEFLFPSLGSVIIRLYNFQKPNSINELYRKILNEDVLTEETIGQIENILKFRHKIIHKHQYTRPRSLDNLLFERIPNISNKDILKIQRIYMELVLKIEIKLRQKTFKCWLNEQKKDQESLDYYKLRNKYSEFLSYFYFNPKDKKIGTWKNDIKIIGKD
jgi:hypothetical protein